MAIIARPCAEVHPIARHPTPNAAVHALHSEDPDPA